MRGLALIASGLCLVSSAACTTIDRYSGADGPPGGYISGTSSFDRTMSDLNPFSNYNHQWTLVRVIAPPGATRCSIVDDNPFAPDGPKTEGVPNARREVMLAYIASSPTAAFACNTPEGRVKRTVRAVPYDMTYRDTVVSTVQVKPPLVHIDAADPDADARWTSLMNEICPTVSERAPGFACKPGMLAKLKAADLAADD